MAPDNSERLHALAALALSEATPSGPCPSDEELAAWHGDALAEVDMKRVTAHVAHCERCYTIYASFLDIEQPHEAPAVQARPGASWLRRLLDAYTGPQLAGAAASVFVAGIIGIGLLQFAGQPASLPGYELSLAGKLTMRGAESPDDTAIDEPVRFDPGNEFTLLLRPVEAFDGAVEARAFLRRDGRLTPLIAPAAQVTPKGVVRLTGEVGADVQLPPGESALLVVIGRADALPAPEELARALDGQGVVTRRGWTGWRVALEVTE